jgi:hypothetical protein
VGRGGVRRKPVRGVAEDRAAILLADWLKAVTEQAAHELADGYDQVLNASISEDYFNEIATR